MSEADIATLYAKHGYSLFRRCLRLVGSAADARELVQATFCRFCEGRTRFLRKDSAFRMLYAVATDLSLEAARKRPPLTQAPMRTVDGVDEDVYLARYLADDLSPISRRVLEDELAADPASHIRLAVMRSERTAFYGNAPAEDFARNVAAIVQSRGKTGAYLRLMARAAVLGALLGLVAFGISIAPRLLESVRKPSRPPPPHVKLADPEPELPAEPVLVTQKPAEPAKPETPPPPVKLPEPERQLPTEPLPERAPPATKVAPASKPALAAEGGEPDAPKMMTTYDFGPELGRTSLTEGKSKQRPVPLGTEVQVRASIPEEGFASVLSYDAATQTLQVLRAPAKVQPGWRILGRFPIERSQRFYMFFSTEPVPLQRLLAAATKELKADPKALLPEVQRQTFIDVSVEAPTPP